MRWRRHERYGPALPISASFRACVSYVLRQKYEGTDTLGAVQLIKIAGIKSFVECGVVSRISALLDDRETAEPALYAIKGCCDLLGNIHMKHLLESTCVSVSAMSVW